MNVDNLKLEFEWNFIKFYGFFYFNALCVLCWVIKISESTVWLRCVLCSICYSLSLQLNEWLVFRRHFNCSACMGACRGKGTCERNTVRHRWSTVHSNKDRTGSAYVRVCACVRIVFVTFVLHTDSVVCGERMSEERNGHEYRQEQRENERECELYNAGKYTYGNFECVQCEQLVSCYDWNVSFFKSCEFKI